MKMMDKISKLHIYPWCCTHCKGMLARPLQRNKIGMHRIHGGGNNKDHSGLQGCQHLSL
jgi:hypothetical protein